MSAFEAGFTDSSHINDTDLTNANVIAHACCYYDHLNPTTNPDDNVVIIDFGTTGADNYLKTYTPVGGAESINSQRHEGKYDNTKYRLVTSSGYSEAFENQEDYCRIEGLQLLNTNETGFRVVRIDGGGEVQCNSNIVFCAGGADKLVDFDYVDANLVLKIWDNILYDGTYAMYYDYGASGLYFDIYNNTVCDCTEGIHIIGSSGNVSLYIKNNIVFNTDDDYNISGFTIYDYNYNMGEDAAFTGDDNYVQTSQAGTAIFDDYNADDFHIQSGSDATDAGDDLSSDSNLPIWRDIDGNERGASWDIGADEYVSAGPSISIPVIMHHYRQQRL